MKYIDSEKLIAEIERRISICEKQRTDAIEVECYNLADDASARMGELRDILEIITSLQQEHEIIEFSFKGGTDKINGEEKPFKGGKAKIIILEINPEEGNE